MLDDEDKERERSGGDSAREHAYKRGGKVIARGARQQAAVLTRGVEACAR